MNFELSTEQKLVRESVRAFAETEIKPIVNQLDKEEQFSIQLTKRMGQLGLFGMNIPDEYGGQGLDTLSYIIAVEEIARVDGSQAATLAAHNSLGIDPILNFGSKEQKQLLLPKLCTGDYLWAFGLTEPDAGSDSRGTRSTAILVDGYWVLNGKKVFITNGSTEITLGATVQVVTGKKNEKPEFTTILVETGTNGFTQRTMKEKLMWRASNTSELFFDDCKVPEENILGTKGQGSKIMLSTLDGGRLSIAAMGLGLAQGAMEMAKKYASERKQFNQPIISFQAISFKLADMVVKIDLARTYLYYACWLKDNGKPFSKEAAITKLYCSEIAKEVADEAVQIFGGYGLMKEYNIERFYRDQRLLQIGEGTSEILRLVISRHID
jgi:alkylation response protein AidB-like acyl-CoA dehydrogenase